MEKIKVKSKKKKNFKNMIGSRIFKEKETIQNTNENREFRNPK